MKKIVLFFIFLFLPAGLFAQGSIGMITPPPNPSADYCEKLGYQFAIQETSEGQLGICRVAEGTDVPAWKFLRGEEAQEYSYCGQAGYEMKVVDDPKKCGLTYRPGHGCLVCLLEDSSVVEVYNLMKIEKENKTPSPIDDKKGIICQTDGKCQGGENAETCPQDCSFIKSPTTTKSSVHLTYIFWGIIIITVVIAGFVVFKITRNKDNQI